MKGWQLNLKDILEDIYLNGYQCGNLNDSDYEQYANEIAAIVLRADEDDDLREQLIKYL